MSSREYFTAQFKAHITTYQSQLDLARILFTIKVDKKNYGISLLGIKRSPAELFYHTTWPKNVQRDLENAKSGEKTRRPDHLSFHADGNVHMRTGKKGVFGNSWSFPDHTFLPKKSSSISPLFVHSVKVNNHEYDLPLLDEISNKSYHLTEQVAVVDSPKKFSISLFLIPSDISTSDALSGMWIDYHSIDHPPIRLDFRNLCSEGFYPGRFNIEWSGWDILFVLSDLIMPVPSDIVPKEYFKIITIANSFRCFEKLLAQRIGRVEFS